MLNRKLVVVGIAALAVIGGTHLPNQPTVRLSLRITEENVFNDMFLAVQVSSQEEIGQETLEVTVTAQRGGGRCVYTNNRAIWGRESGWVTLDGDLAKCPMGATFPVTRIAKVTAVVDRGLLSKAKKLSCTNSEISPKRGIRNYSCS